MGFISEQAAPKRHAVEFKRGFSPFEFARMVRWLKQNQPQTIVLLHCPWWVSAAAWFAHVPERIGRKSHWHSFLFLNLPIRQKRSLSDRHESDFNFDLLEWGFNHLGLPKTWHLDEVKKTFLRLVAPNPFGTLAARGLKSKGYRIVHPGMAGSALNWPQEFFVELIERLAKEVPVLITGTKADAKYLRQITPVKDFPNVHWLVGELKSPELLDLLAQAKSVVAPSTGVLHLAASLGTPTIGIYSPRRVEHPKRWGPRGLFVTHLVPPVQEADMFNPDVMTQISPHLVHKAVLDIERKSCP